MNLQKPLIKQGWLRAIIYLIAIVAMVSIITIYAADQYVVLAAGVLLITYLLRTFLDRQSFISLGFNFKGYANESLLGFFAAIAIIGMGTLVLIFSGYLSFIGLSYENEILITIGFLAAVAFVEEIVFRGYLLNNLMQSMNKWIALFITAILFTLVHAQNPGIAILSLLNIFVAGVLLGINYIYTKNLWFSIFFHFAWNVFQGPVLGYEVSGLDMNSLLQQNLDGPALLTGGVFGFEGSVICPALILLVTIWFALSFKRRYSTG